MVAPRILARGARGEEYGLADSPRSGVEQGSRGMTSILNEQAEFFGMAQSLGSLRLGALASPPCSYLTNRSEVVPAPPGAAHKHPET